MCVTFCIDDKKLTKNIFTQQIRSHNTTRQLKDKREKKVIQSSATGAMETIKVT